MEGIRMYWRNLTLTIDDFSVFNTIISALRLFSSNKPDKVLKQLTSFYYFHVISHFKQLLVFHISIICAFHGLIPGKGNVYAWKVCIWKYRSDLKVLHCASVLEVCVLTAVFSLTVYFFMFYFSHILSVERNRSVKLFFLIFTPPCRLELLTFRNDHCQIHVLLHCVWIFVFSWQ